MKHGISVAGVGLTIEATAPLPGKLSDKHPLFLAPAETEGIRLHWQGALAHTPGEPLFDSQSVWSVDRVGDRYLYRFFSPVFSPEVYKSVEIDREYREGTLATPGVARDVTRPLAHPLDAPLDQLLLSHHFAIRGHVELHACGLLRNGKAIVLTGFSGAGKSTSARLWTAHRPEVRVLSDDRVIVRRDAGRLSVWGTPWCGEGQFALNAGAPLGAIVFIHHGKDNAVRPMDPRVAARELYARTFPPAWNQQAVDAVLTTVTEMAAAVPVLRFDALADASAVDALDAALNACLG